MTYKELRDINNSHGPTVTPHSVNSQFRTLIVNDVRAVHLHSLYYIGLQENGKNDIDCLNAQVSQLSQYFSLYQNTRVSP